MGSVYVLNSPLVYDFSSFLRTPFSRYSFSHWPSFVYREYTHKPPYNPLLHILSSGSSNVSKLVSSVCYHLLLPTWQEHLVQLIEPERGPSLSLGDFLKTVSSKYHLYYKTVDTFSTHIPHPPLQVIITEVLIRRIKPERPGTSKNLFHYLWLDPANFTIKLRPGH